MFQRLFAWMRVHERHLSALAMLAGFVWDNIFFGRVDLWQTQAVFAAYTAICFVSIPLLHSLASRGPLPKWSIILPLATQFALGGFWSGFVIFYGRSAVLGASWPFLLFLVLVLLGSEYFHRYHERLVFTTVLFFFALYSYAIFALPIYTGNIGTGTFVLSTILAIALFALFTVLLRTVAREQFLSDIWRIRLGAGVVVVSILVAYGTNILPPLPLSSIAGGIYHSVWRTPGAYLASNEPQSFWVKYVGATPALHLPLGDSISAYSSIFAPGALSTRIVHEWQWYDGERWITKATIAYPISGGRDNGYQGYSTITIREAGKWRVNIKTMDGRLIDRLPFTVANGPIPPLSAVTL